MNTKLTLTIEKEVIETAKEYAKERGQSLSEMVENYFKLVTGERRQIKPEQLSPRIQRLRGIIKTGKNFNHKQILTEELSKIWPLNDTSKNNYHANLFRINNDIGQTNF